MVSSHKQSAERKPQWKEQSFSTDPYPTSIYHDPSTVLSTSDWDELAKICQHDWTEDLKISKAAKFEVIRSHLYGERGGGGKFVSPRPTIQMSVQLAVSLLSLDI